MKRYYSVIAAFLLLAAPSRLRAAELKLASVFTDHMVLQREMPVPIWGWARPGDTVVIEFSGQKKTATAGGSGQALSGKSAAARWMVRLDPMPANASSRAN